MGRSTIRVKDEKDLMEGRIMPRRLMRKERRGEMNVEGERLNWRGWGQGDMPDCESSRVSCLQKHFSSDGRNRTPSGGEIREL